MNVNKIHVFFFRTIQHKYVKLNADEDNLFGLVFNLTVIFIYIKQMSFVLYILLMGVVMSVNMYIDFVSFEDFSK